ncbi:MAG: enoyl-CoA hydratase-related protein [Dehalococcoidia bacterium]|nr:enoyl-CoA hydratase-related protein [Dehalococcoidia bacterium]
MSEVIYEKRGHIAYIRLNRPSSLNALTIAVAREFAKIWCDFRDSKELWVAILSGEGRSFCAGADVKELKVGKWNIRQSFIFGDERFTPSNYNIWKPIIGALHGHVYGAGLWLALECDLRIASKNARFGAPEGKVGIVTLFAPFLSDYLPRTVSNELLLTGEPIDAERAFQLGLVNKVVPNEELMQTATVTAEVICNSSPLATWGTKELILRSRDRDQASVKALVEEIVTPIFNSEDMIEGQRAFSEKRKPIWKLR